MSIALLAKAIGKRADFKTTDGLVMKVTITDAKQAYGNERFVITDDLGNVITVDAFRVTVAEVNA